MFLLLGVDSCWPDFCKRSLVSTHLLRRLGVRLRLHLTHQVPVLWVRKLKAKVKIQVSMRPLENMQNLNFKLDDIAKERLTF